MMDKDIIDYREKIFGTDILVENIQGKKMRYINFDNAATTPPFKSVVNSIEEYLNYYASVGRGVGYKAKLSSNLYNESRIKIKQFFNIDDNSYTVIYCMNTTQAINILAATMIRDRKDIIIATKMEHHSNDLPWRKYGTVKYVDVDKYGKLKMDQFEMLCKKYKKHLKVIAVTGASNITGYINNIHYIAKIAHKYNAKIVVDGAQLVPHKKVNILGQDIDEDIDFLVFSAHKMYAPFGTGVIVGKKDIFGKSEPVIPGGGTVDVVGENKVFWADVPEKEEGGTPNIVGVISLIAAIKEITNIGIDKIEQKENLLKDYFTNKMKEIPEVILYYDVNDTDRVSVCCFNIKGRKHQEVAEYLSNNKCIGLRTGCFCAQPYAKKLLGLKDEETFIYAKDKTLSSPGLVRVSFAFYNTIEEIDYFVEAIKDFINNDN